MKEESVLEHAGAPTSTTAAAHGGDGDTVEWEFDIPLLTNRFMVWDFLRVTAFSVAAMWLIVAAMGWIIEGELVLLPLEVLILTAGILLVLFALASLLLGNRHGARFTVGPDGVRYAARLRERRINTLVTVLGVLAGSPTAAGAGLLAKGQERLDVPWTSIERLVIHRSARVIVVRNSWRAVLRLHCPPELFGRVLDLAEEYWSASRPAHEAAQRRGAENKTPVRSWSSRLGLALVVLVLTICARIWPWTEPEIATRIGSLGAAALVLSSLTELAGRRLWAWLALPLLLWHAGATASSALKPFGLGTTQGVTWMLDTPLLALSAAALLGSLGIAVWRAFGRLPG